MRSVKVFPIFPLTSAKALRESFVTRLLRFLQSYWSYIGSNCSIRFIENDVLDSRLPLDEVTLKNLIPEAVKRFENLQYEYLAYSFRSGQYHKKLSDHQILPFIQEECIGGGGFSSVYKVRVRTSHQNFVDKASPHVCSESSPRYCLRLITQLGFGSHSERAQATSSR